MRLEGKWHTTTEGGGSSLKGLFGLIALAAFGIGVASLVPAWLVSTAGWVLAIGALAGAVRKIAGDVRRTWRIVRGWLSPVPGRLINPGQEASAVQSATRPEVHQHYHNDTHVYLADPGQAAAILSQRNGGGDQ